MGRKKLDNAVLFMRVPSEMLPRLKVVVKEEIERRKKFAEKFNVVSVCIEPPNTDTNHSSQNSQNETI